MKKIKDYFILLKKNFRRQEEPIAVSPNEYRATVGISALNGACLIDHRYGQTHSVAIILDDGNFSGVQTAAHEIGHL